MWGKIPKVKASDKRKRCSQIVMRGNLLDKCTRIARGYRISKGNQVLSECLPLCAGHRNHFEKMRFVVELLDMRKARGEAE